MLDGKISRRDLIRKGGALAGTLAFGNFLSQVASIGAESRDKFVFGFIGPMTGPVAETQQACRRGTKLAIDEIKSGGGIQVGGKTYNLDFVEIDSECKPEIGTAAIERLIEVNQVPIIMGEICSSATLAEMQVVAVKEVPFITPIAVNPKITDPEFTNPYMFRTCQTSIMNAKYATKAIKEALEEIETIGMLAVNDDYGRGQVESFSEYFKEAGVKTVSEEYFMLEQQDFLAELTKIKQRNPDAIYLVGRAIPNAVSTIKQARQVGFETIILSTGFNQAQVALQVGESLIKGVYSVSTFEASTPDPVVQEFTRKYVNLYNVAPSLFAALPYDTVYVIADSVERAGSFDSKDIRDALAEAQVPNRVGNYPNGTIKFNEWGQVEYRPGLVRFTGRGAEKEIVYLPL